METTPTIRKDLFEVHKPSGQISAKLTKNGVLHQLTPVQFDTINFMCYKSREHFHKKYKGENGLKKEINKFKTQEAVDNFLSNHEFEMDLNDLTLFTNSYDDNKPKLLKSIKELKEITVEMGLFKKHDLSVEHTFSLLRRYSKTNNSSIIHYKLEPEILYGWLFTTKPYSKMYLTVQAQLKYTYTKILYENLKDYENQGTVSKPLKLWNYILGFDSSASKYVSTLKRDYLNKAVKDINKTTDIFVDSIKSKKVDGEVHMIIDFHKQDCEIIDATPIDETSDDNIKEKMIDSKIEKEAIKRLETAKENGIVIKSDKAYIEKLKATISKEEIENQIMLDELISDEFSSPEDFAEYLNEVSEWYTKKTKSKLNIYLVYKNYKLLDAFTNKLITNDSIETVELLRNYGEDE